MDGVQLTAAQAAMADGAAREAKLNRALDLAQTEERVATNVSGDDAAYLYGAKAPPAAYLTPMSAGLIAKLCRRQDGLCARIASMHMEQAEQKRDMDFSMDRAAGLAGVACSMQASLTTNSTTLRGMDSFVGRICKSPRSMRNRTTSKSSKSSPQTLVRGFNTSKK